MQFWQNHQKEFNIWSKIFNSKSQNVNKILLFSKWLIFLNLFLWTRRVRLWEPSKKLADKKPEKISSKFECDMQTMSLSNKISPFKLVLWTRKLLFWQPYEVFPAETLKFFNQGSEKGLKNILFFRKRFFSHYVPTETKGGAVTTSPKNFRQKAEVFSFKVRLCFENWTVFKKSFFASNCSFGHVESGSDSSNDVFKAGWKLFTQYPKKSGKALISFRKISLLQKFIWKHRINFEKNRRNLVDRSLKICSSKSEVDEETIFFPYKSLFPQNGPMDT